MAKNTLSLTSLSVDQLQADLGSLEATFGDNKFNHASQGISNPMELRAQRRDIARYKTEIRGREVAQFTQEQLDSRSKLRARRKRGA